jgi:hypothetical protein
MTTTDKTGYIGLTRPEFLPPMDWDQFAFAWDTAVAAGHLTMPVRNPETYHMNVELEDGDVREYVPRDMPLNRAALAVREHFAEDRESFFNFMTRFFALLDVFRIGTVSEWCCQNPKDPEAQDIHPAVIYAAAELKLNAEGHFPADEFHARVAALVSEIKVDG